jgi:agmatinase
LKIHDGGDLEIPFGNTQRVIDMTEDYAAGILSDKKLPLMIGGEHLVSLGAIKAALKNTLICI